MKTILVLVASLFIQNSFAQQTNCMGVHRPELKYYGWVYEGGANPGPGIIVQSDLWKMDETILGEVSRYNDGRTESMGVQGTFVGPEVILDNSHAEDRPQGWIIYSEVLQIEGVELSPMVCVKHFPTIEAP